MDEAQKQNFIQALRGDNIHEAQDAIRFLQSGAMNEAQKQHFITALGNGGPLIEAMKRRMAASRDSLARPFPRSESSTAFNNQQVSSQVANLALPPRPEVKGVPPVSQSPSPITRLALPPRPQAPSVTSASHLYVSQSPTPALSVNRQPSVSIAGLSPPPSLQAPHDGRYPQTLSRPESNISQQPSPIVTPAMTPVSQPSPAIPGLTLPPVYPRAANSTPVQVTSQTAVPNTQHVSASTRSAPEYHPLIPNVNSNTRLPSSVARLALPPEPKVLSVPQPPQPLAPTAVVNRAPSLSNVSPASWSPQSQAGGCNHVQQPPSSIPGLALPPHSPPHGVYSSPFAPSCSPAALVSTQAGSPIAPPTLQAPFQGTPTAVPVIAPANAVPSGHRSTHGPRQQKYQQQHTARRGKRHSPYSVTQVSSPGLSPKSMRPTTALVNTAPTGVPQKNEDHPQTPFPAPRIVGGSPTTNIDPHSIITYPRVIHYSSSPVHCTGKGLPARIYCPELLPKTYILPPIRAAFIEQSNIPAQTSVLQDVQTFPITRIKPQEFMEKVTVSHNTHYKPPVARVFDMLFMQVLLFHNSRVLLVSPQHKDIKSDFWEPPQSVRHAHEMLSSDHTLSEHALSAIHRITGFMPDDIVPGIPSRRDCAISLTKPDKKTTVYGWSMTLSYEIKLDKPNLLPINSTPDLKEMWFHEADVRGLDMSPAWKDKVLEMFRLRRVAEQQVFAFGKSAAWLDGSR